MHVEVTREREHALAFDLVDEDRDGKQVVADRQLVIGEDGPRRDAELMVAGLALEQRTALIGIGSAAGAARANRLGRSFGSNGCGERWLRLFEQLPAKDKWIPAGFAGLRGFARLA